MEKFILYAVAPILKAHFSLKKAWCLLKGYGERPGFFKRLTLPKLVTTVC